MKNLYQVTAIKNRKIKGVNGYFTAGEGYVVHNCFQVAASPSEAVETVKAYYMGGKKYDRLEVSFIREAS